MIDILYKQFASYYAGVTSDRNYKGHIALILDSFEPERPCLTFMELFAGQALHGLEAAKNKDIDLWALDSSAQMKDIAIMEGFEKPNQYIVGALPEAILECAGKVIFDGMIALSCSITYLDKAALYQLLKNTKETLRKKGKIFIETYDNISFMGEVEQSIAHTGTYSWFPDIQTPNGEIVRLAWPSEKIRWNANSYSIEIPVKLYIVSEKGTETVEFISKQHIHSAEDIIFVGNLLGYSSKILSADAQWKTTFDNNVVIELTYE